MIKVKLYSIYDKAANTFAEPFTAVNDDVAKRNFRFTMSRYADYFVKDMILYNVGTFDCDVGALCSTSINHFVDSGEQILADKMSQEELKDEKKEAEE